MTAPLLEIDHLHVDIPVGGAAAHGHPRRVASRSGAGEALGLVGESGSGKSMTARADHAAAAARRRGRAAPSRFDGEPGLAMSPARAAPLPRAPK